MMLAAELALARVDVTIVERRPSQDLEGSRARGLLSRTIEVLDQRGIADRFLSQGKVLQVGGFATARLDDSDVDLRQCELRRQHHSRRTSSGDHHCMLGHVGHGDDCAASPGACGKPRVWHMTEVGGMG